MNPAGVAHYGIYGSLKQLASGAGDEGAWGAAACHPAVLGRLSRWLAHARGHDDTNEHTFSCMSIRHCLVMNVQHLLHGMRP